MVMGFIEIKEIGAYPRRLHKAWRAAAKTAWRNSGKLHHTQNRPKRFTTRGARELKFARRSPKYTASKQRRFGHRDPLKYSGESERRARSSRITSTSKGVRIRYNVPALNFRNPASRIHPAEEFRRISQREAKEIARFIGRDIDKRLAADQSTNTQKVS